MRADHVHAGHEVHSYNLMSVLHRLTTSINSKYALNWPKNICAFTSISIYSQICLKRTLHYSRENVPTSQVPSKHLTKINMRRCPNYHRVSSTGMSLKDRFYCNKHGGTHICHTEGPNKTRYRHIEIHDFSIFISAEFTGLFKSIHDRPFGLEDHID